MSDPTPDELLARLHALAPEERARLLAQLGLSPSAAIDFGSNNRFGAVTTGDVVVGDKITVGAITDSAAAIGAGASTTRGGVDVSGSAQGVIVGVNQGTIVVGPAGAPTPAAEQSGSPSAAQIDAQHERLAAHRATLATLLYQLALHSSAYAPPALVHGIHEARKEIARIKATLRSWDVAVADLPDDDLRR